MTAVFAQVKLEDIPSKLEELFGKSKLLTVKKGFNPVFKLGDFQVNKVGFLGEKLKGVEILGQIFNKKGVDKVTKLYKTYKTGLVVFKVLAAAGTAVTVVSTRDNPIYALISIFIISRKHPHQCLMKQVQ